MPGLGRGHVQHKNSASAISGSTDTLPWEKGQASRKANVAV